MLTTNPSAVKLLLAKSSLVDRADNLNTLVVNQQSHSHSSVTFTTDFVKYYFGNFLFNLTFLIKKKNSKILLI